MKPTLARRPAKPKPPPRSRVVQPELFPTKAKRSSSKASSRRPEKPVARRSNKVPHSTRPPVSGPVHVVVRIRRGLPDLRSPKALHRLENVFRKCNTKPGFALVHYNIERDHIHLGTEVTDKESLSLGMQGLNISIARNLNDHWHRRLGHVFDERYFALELKSERQVWRCLRYILNNGRKHGTWTVQGEPDPYSSGPWFRGWSQRNEICRPTRSPPVAPAKRFATCLFIDVNDVPGLWLKG